MTALENVAVPLELAGNADAFAVAGDELGAVGLGDRLGHYPAQLSGGEQQRVAIARAIATAPSILLADEPTGNLDSLTGQKILDLLQGLNQSQRVTVVMVTHNVFAATYGDRTLEVQDGRIIRDVRTPDKGRGAKAAAEER
jgi:putative ABC transport system ATP-binding protein